MLAFLIWNETNVLFVIYYSAQNNFLQLVLWRCHCYWQEVNLKSWSSWLQWNTHSNQPSAATCLSETDTKIKSFISSPANRTCPNHFPPKIDLESKLSINIPARSFMVKCLRTIDWEKGSTISSEAIDELFSSEKGRKDGECSVGLPKGG